VKFVKICHIPSAVLLTDTYIQTNAIPTTHSCGIVYVYNFDQFTHSVIVVIGNRKKTKASFKGDNTYRQYVTQGAVQHDWS